MSTSERPAEGKVVSHLHVLFTRGTTAGSTEGQLLERFASGRDESAFEALVERHGPMVLGVCRRFLRDPNDVDDAFQATFLILARKARTLSRKDLLGNWLYGVACRVSRRARGVAARRSSRFTAFEDDQQLAAGRSPGDDESWPGLMREEESSIVFEEVERLPRKYRLPIVLCYLDGLTHEQAAVGLGWPVGTVKGRLSRAREILRSRLSRRGVTTPAAILATHFSASESTASVPEWLVRTTLRTVLGASSRAGASIVASSAVSLPVLSLTEGVLHAMVLSHAKAIAIPLLVGVGVLSASASVVAYQFASPVDAPVPNGLVAQSSRPAPKATQADDSAVQPDSRTARSVLDTLRKTYAQGVEGLIIDADQYNNWSLNLFFNEMLEDPSEDGRAKALEGHRDRLAAILKELTPRSESGKVPKSVISAFEHQLKRAETMVAKNPRSMSGMGMSGVMGGMMGGLRGNAGPSRGRMEGMGGLGSGGMGGMSGMGGMMMGMRGQNPDPRIEIARMSAEVSTLDRGPRTEAVQNKLDEPMTLRFEDQTPLSEVLKYIKQNFKNSDGKRLPVFVDPQGLQDAGQSLDSPVSIDLEDVPLRFSLRLLLRPLGLAYCVRDGVLIISSVEGIQQELREAESEQRALHPPQAGLQ